ncbi:Hypothetical predicted protein [Marmota monax]|uniref:Ankyrin repeat domain-containing protein 34B-like n=1 Tax=Marmota monax TaxID=9995 RepID=A0A5E4D800_MARMO|nr:ankyrin repeat domain-containing protein 34B-like [Marmota monax]VTJ88929.1 Hypothetical predicted protein [Marmota monax]
MVETLIQNKANIHAVDQKGRTALMFALEQKSKHIVEMLLQSGIDVSAADNFGQMALAYAIASGDTSLKKLILQYMKVESKHPENINPAWKNYHKTTKSTQTQDSSFQRLIMNRSRRNGLGPLDLKSEKS